MVATLHHRGPDGEGVLQCGDGGPVLAHRRLAIVDLSPTGQQPMRSATGRYVVTFNGEVYNHAELRRELDAAGGAPAWRGTSDTEVMLAAIDAWGLERALDRFVGMFAFALWDEQQRVLHLVRDRLGIKPLYWTRTPTGLAFASELKALRRFPGFDSTIHPEAFAGFLAANCVAGEQSIFRGSWRVLPGMHLTFAAPDAAPTRRAWWSAADIARAGLRAPFTGNEADAADELEALLRESVRLRMMADVPLGAFLSGGIDSSTVVALMQAQSTRPVHTFSIANEVAPIDESRAFNAVARHLGTQHTALTVRVQDALDVIPLLPTMFDEPFSDSSQIPTFLVSRLARRDVTVALSGDGGDELFGGYSRHVFGPPLWRLQQLLPPHGRRLLARAITGQSVETWDRLFGLLPGFVPTPRIPGLRLHKAAAALTAHTPEAMHTIFSSHWQPSDGVLRDSRAAHGHDDTPLLRNEGGGVAEEMMLRDTLAYLPDDILTKVDRASMAVSLEARVPLLDHRVFAFAWRLPLRMKIRGRTGKWLLRQVLDRHVPRRLVSPGKMGFGIPLGLWLRGPLRAWAEALLTPAALSTSGFVPAVVRQRWSELLSGQRPWEYHLWDVLMFQAWLEAQRR